MASKGVVSWARGFNGVLAQAAQISPSEQSSVIHFLGLLGDLLSLGISLASGEGRSFCYPALLRDQEEGGSG